ncbi:hypothetical protein CPAR01_04778 [Colletotrichum paranaense]|uniref:Uncharacterized protein n=1 Tax=Colletotrichum paranaense TaxID=1914294 RepID=A0ABQ9SXS8_9PEZI|nr:uncharacterized protein CPAR01_04778 [Colletotrichum paranaense]KAK1544145.1 hypothetical protein CPAR01_04778 [Colletotrichum paranaense]
MGWTGSVKLEGGVEKREADVRQEAPEIAADADAVPLRENNNKTM